MQESSRNVLVWFSEVNAKGPLSSLHAAPHQDSQVYSDDFDDGEPQPASPAPASSSG
ncbi:hypothetical protein AK812_SmicGene44873, partial [Symbiodinium microadriaticum]